MIYTLPFPPIPLARPRFSRYGRVFDSQSAEKQQLQLYLLVNYGKNIRTKPLILDVTFYIKIPKTSKRKVFAGMVAPLRPDLDNYLKLLLDLLTEIFYEDDAQIIEIHAKKIYDYEPRTQFELRET